jgi:MFS superfamily sulfate permease-like transporter/mannitol/fructose-specific phosphotransferase system IIA component (Ntr-type)
MSKRFAYFASMTHGGEGWRGNVVPAVVVVLISIPLSMGIAIASGVPPVLGLVTAIVGGMIIGALAGSPIQISGPSAGLAVMVLEIVTGRGLEALAVIVMIMGALQIASGLLRLGQMFRAVSPAVINGMLAGIGVLILSAQFHVMVDDNPRSTGLENLLSIPESIYRGIGGEISHRWAASIGVLTLSILVVMPALRKSSIAKLPAPLVAVIVASFVAWICDAPIQRVDMPDSVLTALTLPSADTLSLLREPGIWGSAIALAFVASAETLLCANAVDAMHEGPRTNYDRELLAQGVGNSVCGLLGTLPTTGVITRSTANVQAGATSRHSAIMIGACLLGVLVIFPRALEVIPRACLAAMLVHVGFKLVKERPYAELRRFGESELAIFAATLAIIVSANLLTGIVVGFILAAGKLIGSQREKFHKFKIDIAKDQETEQTHLHIRGAASFLRIPKLAAALESLPHEGEVHLHVEELEYIDHACLDLLDRWECERIRAGAPVRVQWQTLHHRYHAGNFMDRTPDAHAELPELEHLLDFLTPERIIIGPAFHDKWQAIDAIAHLLTDSKSGVSHKDLVAAARQREHEASTCIGRGLMIPHGTISDECPLMGGMAISNEGWDFHAEDGKRVHCVVLLATPDDQASHHLAVLAAFARLFISQVDLRDRLIAAKTPTEAYNLLFGEGAETINYPIESRPSTES